jgi:hypothetical protein
MGLLSKLFKGIKKVVRKIGGGIKRIVKKVGGVFGKMGILGHIGMMFLMPYAQSFWGSLGTFGTKLAQGTSLAGKGFGHVMRGIYHAGKSVGTVYRGVTEAIEGSLKWLSNKAGLTDITDPFSGLNKVVQDAQNWGRAGWTGDRIHEISTYALPDKIGTTGSGRPEGMPTEDYIESLDKKQRELMEGPKKQIDPQTTDTTTVDVDLEGQSLLSSLGENAKEKFRETIVDAPSMLVRDVLKTGVQKAFMGKPQVSYGGSIQFNMGGTNKVITDSQIGGDPNNLYSQGYSYGSPFMQAFSDSVFTTGEDKEWAQWLDLGYAPEDSLSKAYYSQTAE